MSYVIKVSLGKVNFAELPKKMKDAGYEEILQQAYLTQGIAQILVRVNRGLLRPRGLKYEPTH